MVNKVYNIGSSITTTIKVIYCIGLLQFSRYTHKNKNYDPTYPITFPNINLGWETKLYFYLVEIETLLYNKDEKELWSPTLVTKCFKKKTRTT